MISDTRTKPDRFKGLLRISEAAELIGVTTETLRNWDKSGRLAPVRNPVTGYRYYDRETIERFRDEIVAEREACRHG